MKADALGLSRVAPGLRGGVVAEARRRLPRLLKMGTAEIAYRGRQETWKWLERTVAVATDGHRPDRILRKLSPEAEQVVRRAGGAKDFDAAATVLLERFRQNGFARFFEGAASGGAAAVLAEAMPEARDQAVAVAEALCEKHFDLLGYQRLFFGEPVDWHLEPVSGRRSPLVHWSRLNPLDPATVGDSKVVWELNRHQWLVQLGEAYACTGDERYAEAFACYVREWLHSNPPGMGINWASSLEVALRLISWCWALFLFGRSPALCPDLFLVMLHAILAHASHVEHYLSYYFSPNTHLTGEALGLFYAGIVFSDLRPAARWRKLGARVLLEQIERQVLPDGVYFEQSTCYQRYTVEIYLHLLILAARSGVPVPAAVSERVRRMLDFLLAVRCPNGAMPQIGDADGGRLMPLACRAANDFRDLFSTAAAWFGRSDYAWAAGGLAPETVWLLGKAGMKTFERLNPCPPEGRGSRGFSDGGYVVMRSGWEPDAHHLIFDVGPLGCPVSGGHGHADLLSIQCSAFGEPYLVDPGTYCYTADREWRDYFRSTTAHNTVVIDEVEQAISAGPFAWRARPRVRLHRWLSTEAFDFAHAEHDGYCRLPDPVIHRRRVLFVKPRYWVVVDDLDGAAEHRLEIRWQFAPLRVTVDPELWIRAHGTLGHGLLIRAFARVPLKAEIQEGEIAPLEGWVSFDYGHRHPAPLLIYRAATRLPLRLVTLLLPVEDPLAPPPRVFPLAADGAGPVGLVFRDTGVSVRFGEGDFFIFRSPEPEVSHERHL